MDQSRAADAQRLAYKKQELILAVRADDRDTIVRLLDEGVPINTRNNEGESVLHGAAQDGHVTTVRLLIRRGCNVDSADARGLTPLHSAAAQGQTKAVCELIRNGASKSQIASIFGTPLHQAVSKGHIETVVAMLDEGCPLDVVNSVGSTVLHWAAEGGHVELVRELVGRGCDVNAVRADGCTPLHCAAAHGGGEAVRELIKLGATKSVVASAFGTPIDQAHCNGNVDTVEAMLEGEMHDLELTKCDVRSVKAVVSECNTIGTSASFGVTPAMSALLYGKVDMFELLISKGGNISDRDIYSLSTFEHCFIGGQGSKLSQFCQACGIVSSGEGLRGALATLINQSLIDSCKVLCLCAISGDSVFLENQFIELLASADYAMPAALKCAQFYFFNGLPFLNQLKIPDGHSLNPLHMSLLSYKCHEMGFATLAVEFGTKDHSLFMEKLLSHPVLKETVHENFPNGLSPLDLSQQFELHHIATLIKGAGGRPGVWADIPQEIEVRHPLALSQVKEAYASMKAIAEDGEDGLEFIKGVFSSILGRQKVESVVNVADDIQLVKEQVLGQRPDLRYIVTHVLPHIQIRLWKRLGLALGMKKSTLDEFDQKFSNDKLLDTLSYWLEQSSSATWKTLLDILGLFVTKHTVDELTDKIVSVLGGDRQVLLQQPSPSGSTGYIEVTSPNSLGQLEAGSKRIAQLSWPPAKQRKILDTEGALCHKERFPKGDTQDQPPAEPVVKCSFTASGGTVHVEASSALVLSGGAVAAERSLPNCEDSLLHSKPTILELLDHVVLRVAARWYHFGLALRVEDCLLENIKVTERGEAEACCTDMLKRWIREEIATGGEERSWSTVLGAVQRCLGWEAAWSIARSLQAAQSHSHSSR